MSELAFAEFQSKVDRIMKKEENRKSEGLAWLNSIVGNVHREIDFEKERSEWRDEKYECAD